MFPVHTTPDEFQNEGFSLKTHQMFSVHTTPDEFKNATITGHFEFVFEENSVRGSNGYHDAIFFRKARFSKCSPATLRHRLHGRGFQSKRFHDLETASKTTRFQRVYTEPIQPLNPTVYVKAISFSGLCTSSIGSGFDQT